jgi:hypothetical protein
VSEYVGQLEKLGDEHPSILRQIRDGAFPEVLARLNSPKRRAAIADGQLFRLFIESSKLLIQLESKPQSASKTQVVNVLNIVRGAQGLPPARQQELLVMAARELEAAGEDAGAIKDALAALTGIDEARKLLAIEA